MKDLFLAVAVILNPIVLLAQIPNASFENGNSEIIDGWKTIKGDAGTTTSYGFKTSFGDTIVNGRFAKLQYDFNDAPIIESTFGWDKRSSVLSGTFIYVPESSSQRFTVQITYLKWQPALLSLDTIAVSSSSINPFNDQKFRNYDWFKVNIPIDKEGFRNNEIPDSCTIRIIVDNGDYTANTTTLLIDELEFGEEVIASSENALIHSISIYPNPSDGFFNIDGLSGDEKISILNLNGQIIKELSSRQSRNMSLEQGYYFIRIQFDDKTVIRKLQIL